MQVLGEHRRTIDDEEDEEDESIEGEVKATSHLKCVMCI